MSISQRGVNSNGVSGTTAGTLTINAPTGTAQGDVLFASIVGTATSDVTPPSGWTTIIALVDGDATAPVGLALFYKVAGASEPGSYTFTSAGATIAGGTIVGFIGASTLTPLDVWASTSTTTYGTSPASSAITASFAGDLALVFIAAASTTSAPNAMTGWTEIYSNPHSVGAYQIDRVGFSKSIAAAGSVASAATTATVTDGWVSVTLALVPSGCIAASAILAGHGQAVVNGQLQASATLAGHGALDANGQLQASASIGGHGGVVVSGAILPRYFGAPVLSTANQQAGIATTANQHPGIGATSRT